MDCIDRTLREIRPLDAGAMRRAEERLDQLTMPPRALGRICDIAVRLCGITGAMPPPAERRLIVTMAGDHGITEEGVSLHSAEVTRQMVANIIAGGAGVNVLARLNGSEVLTADFGMVSRDEDLIEKGLLLDRNAGRGAGNFARGPAMTREQARLAVENGIGIARDHAGRTDVFGTGEMGIGNTSPASAIAACITGRPAAELRGAGTGLDDAGVARKAQIITKALERSRPDPADAWDLLEKAGGFEIAGIAGLILGAAACRKPVLVDGFISTAGAMLARLLSPESSAYMFLSHASAEPGHAAMCRWLGHTPLLDLGMRLGEGTGAALAMNLLGAASRILTEMATFDKAGVDAKHR